MINNVPLSAYELCGSPRLAEELSIDMRAHDTGKAGAHMYSQIIEWNDELFEKQRKSLPVASCADDYTMYDLKRRNKNC